MESTASSHVRAHRGMSGVIEARLGMSVRFPKKGTHSAEGVQARTERWGGELLVVHAGRVEVLLELSGEHDWVLYSVPLALAPPFSSPSRYPSLLVPLRLSVSPSLRLSVSPSQRFTLIPNITYNLM